MVWQATGFFCREEVSNLENACDRPMRRNDIFRNSLKVFLYRLQGMIHDLQKIAPFLETRHTPRIFRFLKRAAIKPHKNISSICTGTCILQHFIKILQQQKTQKPELISYAFDPADQHLAVDAYSENKFYLLVNSWKRFCALFVNWPAEVVFLQVLLSSLLAPVP